MALRSLTESLQPHHTRSMASKAIDTWAFGITMLYMIDGRIPWSIATLSDKQFVAFLNTPGYLHSHLQISIAAEDLLRQILVLEPNHRMPLSEIRLEIHKMNAIYSPKDLGTQCSLGAWDGMPCRHGNIVAIGQACLPGRRRWALRLKNVGLEDSSDSEYMRRRSGSEVGGDLTRCRESAKSPLSAIISVGVATRNWVRRRRGALSRA